MNKLKFETNNLTTKNMEKLAELFPGVVVEGKVNVDLLRSYIGEEIFDNEAYEFTWVGKREAIHEAGRPIRKTLRPCVEESKDWDTTENIYVEGDNLDVLKLLQESYLGKVKMIYIDPPYNTGHDFIYHDNFRSDDDEYNEQVDLFDEDGNKQFRENLSSNPRMHSDWCSMIYPRLVLARNMLRDDGQIFISIDDNEMAQLRKICDEVFGQDGFVSVLTIIVKTEGRRYGAFAKTHENILVYAKNLDSATFNQIEVEGKDFTYHDSIGGFNLQELRNQNARAFNSTNRPNLRYPLYVDVNNPYKDGFCKVSVDRVIGFEEIFAITVNGNKSVWRWGKGKARANQDTELVARKGSDGIVRIYQKYRKLTEEAKTVWFGKEFISNKGTKEVQAILGNGIFDFPKPVALMRQLVTIATYADSIVLDFFSGSATTAHATMQLNAEDGGKRKFIMVQLPEVCTEGKEAAKAGYTNICEIGKERIRRAGEKIKADNPLTTQGLDVGFRVLKLDDSNMKDVYYAAGDYNQESLSMMTSNIKDDRTDLDLLYGCLLDWGLPLSLPHTHEVIDGTTIHIYNNGDLIACFADTVSDAAFKEIARRQPLRAVFRDSSFADSPSKINVEEIFKLLAPNTSVKVI